MLRAESVPNGSVCASQDRDGWDSEIWALGLSQSVCELREDSRRGSEGQEIERFAVTVVVLMVVVMAC